MVDAKERIGVLVMSYGTPSSMEGIEAYYTHIRRGSKPSDEQLQELTDRYEAIVGGVFPLRENTNRQVEALEEALNRLHPEYEYRCFQGLKHAEPFIEDGVAAIAASGIKRGVGIVLAPHYSTMSVGSYIKRAEAKAQEAGVQLSFVESYHLQPDLIRTLGKRVKTALQPFGGEPVRVIFSAHSLPARILDMGDPYPEQLLASSREVAAAAGVTDWQFAWQSAGRTPEPWLGPDIMDVLRTIRQEENVKNVLLCPIGFVSDHLEVLYDVDIECQQLAKEIGLRLARTESLNADPTFIRALADVVHDKGTVQGGR